MRTLTLLLLIISATTGYAQDIITKTNGDEIKAKVVEVESDKVKYRKWENQDGPLYNIDRSQIFMIKYASGEKEVFTTPQAPPPSQPAKTEAPKVESAPQSFQSSNQHKYDSLMQLSKSNRTWGIFGTVVGPVFIGCGLVWYFIPVETVTAARVNLAVGTVCIAAGITELILGPVLLVKSRKQREAAQQYKPSVSMRLPQINYDPQTRAASIKLQMQF